MTAEAPSAAELEPPRECPQCGRRLTVRVFPTRVDARCRDHGTVGEDAVAVEPNVSALE